MMSRIGFELSLGRFSPWAVGDRPVQSAALIPLRVGSRNGLGFGQRQSRGAQGCERPYCCLFEQRRPPVQRKACVHRLSTTEGVRRRDREGTFLYRSRVTLTLPPGRNLHAPSLEHPSCANAKKYLECLPAKMARDPLSTPFRPLHPFVHPPHLTTRLNCPFLLFRTLLYRPSSVN